MRRGVVAIALGVLAAVSIVATASAGIVADMSADWSSANNPNTSNPNGTWEYRQGTTDLPLVPSWNAAGTAPATFPAWAPSNTAGNFLPAWFQATSLVTGVDWELNDIVVHTVDPFNGNPSLGVANVLFTDSSFTGTVTIAGFVWDVCKTTSRPQDWAVLVNGTQMASGSLPGNLDRSSAQTFSIGGVSLAPGDTVEIDEFKDATSADGCFVGSRMQIGTSTVTLKPALLKFGNVAMGDTSLAKAVTVTVAGSAPVNFSTPTTKGIDASDFAITSNTCTGSIADGKKCTIKLTFTPSTPLGTVESPTLNINDDAIGNPQIVPLSGTSATQVTVAPPTTVKFGDVTSGTTKNKTVRLTNNQSIPISVVLGISGPPFAIFSTTCGAMLNPFKACTTTIQFAPTSPGTDTGTFTITDSPDSLSPHNIGLTGKGT